MDGTIKRMTDTREFPIALTLVRYVRRVQKFVITMIALNPACPHNWRPPPCSKVTAARPAYPGTSDDSGNKSMKGMDARDVYMMHSR